MLAKCWPNAGSMLGTNPLNPVFAIAIFIHHKPLTAVAIPKLYYNNIHFIRTKYNSYLGLYKFYKKGCQFMYWYKLWWYD